MTELVRQAVRAFRIREESRPSLNETLKRTSGIWRGKDGLEYHKRIGVVLSLNGVDGDPVSGSLLL